MAAVKKRADNSLNMPAINGRNGRAHKIFKTTLFIFALVGALIFGFFFSDRCSFAPAVDTAVLIDNEQFAIGCGQAVPNGQCGERVFSQLSHQNNSKKQSQREGLATVQPVHLPMFSE